MCENRRAGSLVTRSRPELLTTFSQMFGFWLPSKLSKSVGTFHDEDLYMTVSALPSICPVSSKYTDGTVAS